MPMPTYTTSRDTDVQGERFKSAAEGTLVPLVPIIQAAVAETLDAALHCLFNDGTDVSEPY